MEQQPAPTQRNTSRTLYISGAIDEHLAQDVNTALLKMQNEAPLDDITMVIDSYGGELFAALAIHDMMNMISCDVRTVCIGKAMSAGQFIAASGTKGKRFATKNARMMIHQPIAGAQGSVEDIKIEVDEIYEQRDLIINLLSDNSNLTPAEIKDKIDRNVYFSAEEGIELGFIDGIIKTLK